MPANRLLTRSHRIGIVLAAICGVLALLNLFNSDPRSARNAVELVAIGIGAYVVALAVGVTLARLLRGKDT
jgi:hypothetical protein